MAANPGKRPSEAFRERVRDARKARGWSPAELAERVGMDRSAVTRIELGPPPKGRNVSLDELFVFAFVLGVPPAWLLTPAGSSEVVRITDTETGDAFGVRSWIGGWPLGSEVDDRTLFAVMPEEEMAVQRRPGLVSLRWLWRRLVDASLSQNRERARGALAGIEREVERLRAELDDQAKED